MKINTGLDIEPSNLKNKTNSLEKLAITKSIIKKPIIKAFWMFYGIFLWFSLICLTSCSKMSFLYEANGSISFKKLEVLE